MHHNGEGVRQRSLPGQPDVLKKMKRPVSVSQMKGWDSEEKHLKKREENT